MITAENVRTAILAWPGRYQTADGRTFVGQTVSGLPDVLNAAPPVPSSYRLPAERVFEPCGRCNGSGQTRWGLCFKCRGGGKLAFVQPAAKRAESRAKAADRKTARGDENWTDFQKAQPAVAAWIERAAPTFAFAADMCETVRRFGSLTERQMAACLRCVERAEQRVEARRAAMHVVSVARCGMVMSDMTNGDGRDK